MDLLGPWVWLPALCAAVSGGDDDGLLAGQAAAGRNAAVKEDW